MLTVAPFMHGFLRSSGAGASLRAEGLVQPTLLVEPLASRAAPNLVVVRTCDQTGEQLQRPNVIFRLGGRPHKKRFHCFGLRFPITSVNDLFKYSRRSLKVRPFDAESDGAGLLFQHQHPVGELTLENLPPAPTIH